MKSGKRKGDPFEKLKNVNEAGKGRVGWGSFMTATWEAPDNHWEGISNVIKPSPARITEATTESVARSR